MGYDSLTIAPCHASPRSKMALNQRSAPVVACPLNGAKNGPKIGPRSNTAAIDAGKINEAHYLYPL